MIPANPDLDLLFASPRGTMMLVHAMSEGKIAARIHQDIAIAATSSKAAHARDLLERFLPADRRTQRLGTSFDVDELLAMPGNVDRGAAIFFKADGVTCRNCHQIQGRGVSVGPDLSKVGAKYSKGEILENILRPSKKIDPAFVTCLIITIEGRVLTGVLRERTEEKVSLVDANGKVWDINTNDVDALQTQNKSIMPELLLQEFTAQQAADLLEYLAQLKN